MGTDINVVVVAGIITLVTVLIWIGFLIWGAIEDGREQQRLEAKLREQPRETGMRPRP